MRSVASYRYRQYLASATCIVGVAGAIVLRVFDPANSGVYPPCPLHYLTGLYCPGCGSLRAIHQLLLGNFTNAWALNPLAMTLLPFVFYGLASQALVELRGRGLPEPILPGFWIRALCGMIVLFGILRNIPLCPFDRLAPGAMFHL